MFSFQTSLPQINPSLGIMSGLSNAQGVYGQYLRNNLINSQNQLLQEKIKNPILGQSLTGPAGQIMGLEYIRKLFGDNSPQYAQAQNLFKSQLNLANQRANYFGSNVEYKNLPEIAKLQLAQNQANQSGNFQNANEIQGAKQKAMTTSNNINRATYGDVVKKTINQIPLSTLENFAGGSGEARLGLDKLMNLFGKPSDEYNSYQTFQNTTLPLLREQLTKFYGGSVQPDAQKELDTLANPTSWKDNPTIVRQSLNNLQNLINQESGVYDQSVNQSVPQGDMANIQGLSSNNNTVKMKAPNGNVYEVPQSDVNTLKSQGGVIIG